MKYKSLAQMYEEQKNLPSPSTKFIRKVALLTDRTETTVRKWIAGDTVPSLDVLLKLEQHFKVPYRFLFPNLFKR